jgi:hypothetical protein
MINRAPHPLVLSLSKDEELADALPLMVRQAHHERITLGKLTMSGVRQAHDERSLTASVMPLVPSLPKDKPALHPLVLSLSKDEELADALPLMVRQAHHERGLGLLR